MVFLISSRIVLWLLFRALVSSLTIWPWMMPCIVLFNWSDVILTYWASMGIPSEFTSMALGPFQAR